MHCVSEWYTSLANYTFPTIFIRLKKDEIKTIVENDTKSKIVRPLVSKIQDVVQTLPGKSFIYADCCAPTDSPLFKKRSGAVNSGTTGWQFLLESNKIREAFKTGRTERICLHPYRRLAQLREFRVIVKNRKIVGMSQLYLDMHYPKLRERSNFIWSKGRSLIKEIALFLPCSDIAIDVYLTSRDELMIIDMNNWGPPTDPLLFRNWKHDWGKDGGLKLLTKPLTLKGEVSVSF